MAITGTKSFTAGEILTAANTNQYLMRGVKVFADAATRTAAYGGTGEPTLEEGEATYLLDTNNVEVYDGTNWVTIGPEAVLGQATITAGVSITSTNEASPTDVITAPSVTTVTSQAVYIEASFPRIEPNASETIYLNLWRDTTNLGRIYLAGGVQNGVVCKYRDVPGAGSFVYKVRGWLLAAGTGFVRAGAGGAGNYVPGLITVTRS